jgi:peptidyl-prolyl cis-trans isomerase SurA
MIVIATSAAAAAQNVVIIVNGDPITAIDIEQRMKFTQLSTQKAPSRTDVINELIDEKLKIREGKRWGVELTDAEIDSQYAGMAGRMRQTAEQLTQNLARSGVHPNTLKSRIRADGVWQQLVRGRYQASLQLSDKDVEAVVPKEGEEQDAAVMDYIMRPILLLVTPGSPPAVLEGRRKEADALRGRFRSCEEGIPIARSVRDTAVRDQIIRNSGELPAELLKVLDAVPIGQLTAPEVTKLGVEMYAICGKQPSKADSPTKRKARETVFSQRFAEQSRLYLNRLRREALIERK